MDTPQEGRVSDRGRRGGTRFGRAIVAAILEEVAGRLARIGVIGGTAIDAGHLVGATPPGVAKLLVQQDGLDVATTGVLNFAGPSWVVTWAAAQGRVDIALAGGGLAPAVVYDRAAAIVVERTGGEDVLTRSG
jgi:hypothetical protein